MIQYKTEFLKFTLLSPRCSYEFYDNLIKTFNYEQELKELNTSPCDSD